MTNPTIPRIQRQIASLLRQVVTLSRADGPFVPVSADEDAHATRQAAYAVAMMNQDDARAIRDTETAACEALIHAICAEIKDYDADHSAAYALSQSADRFARKLDEAQVPDVLQRARLVTLGIASYPVPVERACQTCTHPLETREERLRGTCALCKWSDETGGVR